MHKRPEVYVFLVATLSVLVSVTIQRLIDTRHLQQGFTRDNNRMVSLSPAITETLFALGVGHRLVGRTDYCRQPQEAKRLPSAGTSLTPNLEKLVRLRAQHIIAEKAQGVPLSLLQEIAPTTLIPWLTLEEVASGIRTLGTLTSVPEKAEKLAAEIEDKLVAPEPNSGPRLLLLIGMSGADSTSFWYIKPNSLHGQTFGAVGIRNAIQNESQAAPTISIEELIDLNPDVIIAMLAATDSSAPQRQSYLKALGRLTMLKAVQNGSIGFLDDADHFSTGPSIIHFVEALRHELNRLEVEKSQT